MKKTKTTADRPGTIVISLKSGASISLRSYNNLSPAGTLVAAFQSQVRSGDQTDFHRMDIPQSSAGGPRNEVAVRLADVSAIAFIPDR